MTAASTGKNGVVSGHPSVETHVLDAESISFRTDAALGLRMGTTTRTALDGHVPVVARELNRLLSEDLGADEDEEVRELVRKGRKLIDFTSRPGTDAPAFGVFIYLRDIALLTRRLLWVYCERNGLNAP
ncbi:hypothetical protein ACWC24_14305 [Streptomyces sp. NPDC001443]